MRAVLATSDSDINEHFRTQSSQCYEVAGPNARNFSFVADLSSANDTDMDVLSGRMGAPQSWRSVIAEVGATFALARATLRVRREKCGCAAESAALADIRNPSETSPSRLRALPNRWT